MKSKKSSETIKNLEWKKENKSSGWRRVVTTVSFALATWLFSSCDKVPNDKIILDFDKQSVALSFKYQFGSPESGTTVDFNMFVHKDGNKYKWAIEQSDWFFSSTTDIESDNIDWLFEELADKSDSEYITESTRERRDKKLNFAKQAYKDSILNNKNPSKWEIKIKYKPE